MHSSSEDPAAGPTFCRLEHLEIPPELRILVLAPHPDDFDVIAVTLRRLRHQGNPIHLAVLTSGASGVEPGFCAGGDWETLSELREHEQRRSCRFFGLREPDFEFLRLNEDQAGHMTGAEENLERVRTCLKERGPDIVFLPHGNDTNADHRRTYRMLRQIAAFSELTFFAFLIRDPKTLEMRDEVLTFFGQEDADWKAELMRFHESQQQRNLNVRGYGFDERILRLNQRTALRVLGRQNSRDEPSTVEAQPEPDSPSDLFAESFEIEIWEEGWPSTVDCPAG